MMTLSNSRRKTNGFTIVEVLLAATIMVSVLTGLACFMASVRTAIGFSGTETLAGRVVILNPDESTLSSAHMVVAEMNSLNADSCFVVVSAGCWNEQSAANKLPLSHLRDLSRAQLLDPSLVHDRLLLDGFSFSPGEGFTILFVNQSLQMNGALTCAASDTSAANGDPFRIYILRLYEDVTSGWGTAASYEFASPVESSQPLVTPKYSDGKWIVSLPDPSARTAFPDGTPIYSVASKLTYEIASNL